MPFTRDINFVNQEISSMDINLESLENLKKFLNGSVKF
jgi:hypothetical protein